MKFFTVFAAIVAVALASPAEWTLHDLSTAIQDPNTPEALKPILEQALSDLMFDIMSGSSQTTITVSSPVQDFSAWTLNELSEAIQDPATDPELVIYLEHALNNMMADLMAGGAPEYVIVATPVGLLPIESVIVAPAPVDTVVLPPTPEAVVTPAAFSPLVQIIVNVKSQESPAPIVVPEPVVLPPPVNPIVVPEPVVLPPPVNPIVVPEPVVLPPPVIPGGIVPEPVVLPPPVEIIAIHPDVAVNPVDIMHPIPVVAPGGVVGPIV